ncbi:MAG: Holliday junction resolvase RuvX [Acidimicrobiales bacterium]
MRVLALDLGERRIGIALSDSRGVIATPYGVIERSGDPLADRSRIVSLVEETGAGLLLIGLPLSLSGGTGPAARATMAEVEALTALLDVPVATFDERLSTLEAERRRRELVAAVTRPRASRHKLRRGVIDAEAAAIFLGAWLDAHRDRP